MIVRPSADVGVRRGTTANGMKHVTWGDGPKTLLFIQGGPGSHVPKAGMALAATARRFGPYLAAGYRVTMATRRRHMPSGYTFADMADDHARLITEVLGGRADLVVAESYGGMIAQYLAGLHPQRLGHLALIATGCGLSPWSDDLDARLIAALEAGDRPGAAVVFAEELLPGRSTRVLRRLLAPVLARRMVPVDDVLTETRADLTYDPRPHLPAIQAPTLLVCGDRDRFFTQEIVQETAALIPDCELVWRTGKGHAGTTASRRNPQDVLAFVAGSRRGAS